MIPNVVTALLGTVFWFAVIAYCIFGPIRQRRHAKKQQAILDLELSRQERPRRRQAFEAAHRLPPDCLAMLGVSEVSSQAEIDQAWRRKVAEVQPEGSGDILPFSRAFDAYETLCDRKRFISDYPRYLDVYLCAWLAISNWF